MTKTLRQGLSFLMGFGFVFLPTYSPFLSLVFFLNARWSITSVDIVCLISAVIFNLPSLIHHNGVAFLSGLLPFLLAWLIYKASAHLYHNHLLKRVFHLPAIALGLILGLLITVTMSWLNIEGLNFVNSKTLTQAITWASSPAIYGHSIFLLGSLIAIVLPRAFPQVLSLSLSALGILISGSREAAIAWLFVIISLLILNARQRHKEAKHQLVTFLEIIMLIVMLFITSGLGAKLGWGQLGFLLDIAPSSPSTNILQGTEIAQGDWWISTGVRYESMSIEIEEQNLHGYAIYKTEANTWQRLQQIIPLDKGQAYTMSVWLKRSPDSPNTLPGLQGWAGQNFKDGTNEEFSVISYIDIKNKSQSFVSGPGERLAAGLIEDPASDWLRLWVSFRYTGASDKVFFWVGMAPDNRPGLSSQALFAGFQIEKGLEPSDYSPAPANRGLSLAAGRLPYWQKAWQAIRQKPYLGWGDNFSLYYQESIPDHDEAYAIPKHSHNLFLEVLFQGGLLAFCGLLGFLFFLSHQSWQQRDLAFLSVFVGLLFANMVDYSFFQAAILYPLAAMAGWRAASHLPANEAEEERLNQPAVVILLALSDVLWLLLSLGIALLCYKLLGQTLDKLPKALGYLRYCLVLWPLLMWREGLYPGYGLMASQELRKQVTAFSLAAFMTMGILLFFYRDLAIPRLFVVLVWFLSLLIAPFGRWFTKKLLRRLGLWGNRVLIVGAGELGQRIAKSLRLRPLSGLEPQAFFDDAPHKQQKSFEGVEVLGQLQDVEAYAQKHGIKHLIIAISQASSELRHSFLKMQGKTFQKVQFVPELQGLPLDSVHVSSLENFFVIESYNALNVPVNQLLKRALDLFGVIIGGLLISPLILAFAVAIYLDSPGPIFFGHKRLGKGGKHFKAWKFRTMIPDAQNMLDDLLARDESLRQEWNVNQKLKDDPRVTRVGRFLRKYSLDELPQLWNVLKGEMSLVGPRPIVDNEISKYGSAWELYQMVVPGMTGYWQVNGRSDTDYGQRVAMDSFYVRNWSLWLDIIILSQTVEVVLKGDGAY
ncbi:MAG: undecaprenyl-phosphate galactose phosphotransferase WbaP [Deinococcales bacterium]